MNTFQTLPEILKIFRRELAGQYPDNEIRSIFCLVSGHLLNYSKIDIHLNNREPISAIVFDNFMDILGRLRNWEPVQYITGTTGFYNLTYHVDHRVLIPRPETEELVDWIIREERGRAPEVLDIGTGSGCIAVSLAVNLPGARISACDISGNALSLARVNAVDNKADVHFFCCDVLSNMFHLPGKYHVMVSNPPYVRELEKSYMRSNVIDFEPRVALFVPDSDPLVFYRHIALAGRKYISDGGWLYLEINENFPREVVRILQNAGFYGIEVRPDVNDKPRMIRGRK